MGIGLWIGLGVYILYFIAITIFLRKVTNKDLKYLQTPPPNFMHKCQAACRYDFVHLRKWEMYLCAWLIFPFRLVLGVFFIGLTSFFVGVTKILFCGRNIITSHSEQQSEAQRQILCLASETRLHFHAMYSVVSRICMVQEQKTEDQ